MNYQPRGRMRGNLRPVLTPRVSVVLPVFNAAATLGEAIRSIQAQTYSAWELLLVDDGSTDDSARIAEALARTDARLKVIHRRHAGLVPSLAAGLQAAQGQFVARMDADDIALPERLRAQVDYLERNPATGLVGGLVKFGGDRQANLGYALHVDWLNSVVNPADIERNRFIESPFAHPSVLFRRELIAQHGGYREGLFPEDYELWLRWIDAGVSMGKVKQAVLIWNDSPHRLSRTDVRYDAEAFFQIKAGYLARAVAQTRHGRPVWIWGAGRPTRRRADWLLPHGITIHGYVDIDPKKWGRLLQGRPVVGPDKIPAPAKALVVAFVRKRGARELIRAHLTARGFIEGHDFWMAA